MPRGRLCGCNSVQCRQTRNGQGRKYRKYRRKRSHKLLLGTTSLISKLSGNLEGQTCHRTDTAYPPVPESAAMHQGSVLPDDLSFNAYVGYNCVSPAARLQHQVRSRANELCQLPMQRDQLSILGSDPPSSHLQVGRDANRAPHILLYMHRHVPCLCGNCVLSVDMAV